MVENMGLALTGRNKMTYYKVLVKGSQGWRSQCYQFYVYYKHGEWTYPYTIPKSKLFVFDALFYAKAFVEELLSYKGMCRADIDIFECEIKNPSKIKYIASPINELENYWKAKANHKEFPIFLRSPVKAGTVVCDAVKIY
jgi:hypothetical protein